MKNSKLAKIVARIVLPAASLFTGCSSDTGVDFSFLNVRGGNQLATYRENENREGDKTLFGEDCQPYKGDFWKNYKSEH